MNVYLLDTNLILRLCEPNAPQHVIADAAIYNLMVAGDEIVVAPQTLIEFWVVATRPREVNGLGWDVHRTRQEIENLLEQFPLLDESPDVFAHWLSLAYARDIKGKKAHDVRFVALMKAHGITHLLTFNTADFKGFSNITVVDPNDVS